MKNSSYAVISLFSIVVGIVAITPQIIYHRATASVPPTAEPYITVELPASSSVRAATTSDPVPPLVVQPVQPSSAKPVAEKASSPHPIRLSSPAIRLSSRVVPVNLNAKGEMDVPSGTTNDVGWYEGGVLPGERGTAVMDAHVFAAFKNLDSLAVGDDLYVDTADNRRLHFVVRAVRTYLLSDLTPDMLFQATEGRHLNLITCAGSLTSDGATYDRRLIVYTELVS